MCSRRASSAPALTLHRVCGNDRLSNSAIYWTSTPSWPPSCPGGLQTRRFHSHSPLHAWPGAPEARRPTCADDTGHTRPCAFGPEQERRPQTCMPHPPALLLLPPEVHIAYYPTPTRWTPLTQALHASAQWPASRRPQRRCLSRAELRLSLLVAGRAWSCRAASLRSSLRRFHRRRALDYTPTTSRPRGSRVPRPCAWCAWW